MSGVRFSAFAANAADLVHRALFELRTKLEANIEGRCYLTSDRETPAPIPENRDVIESERELIELVRDLQAFQASSPFNENVAWEGPDWLDEIIEQGPAWAGAVS